jgi:hypothetical protein
MATDKELALQMLNAIEDIFLENAVLKSALVGKWDAMDKVLAEAKADAPTRDRVRKIFAPAREKIQQAADLSEAIGEFLRVFPSKKDVN